MGDDEEASGPTYTYTGARAPGETVDVSAGEEPKVLTQSVALLGPRHGEGAASYANSDKYAGGYVEGKRFGTGTYTYAAPAPAEEGEEPKPPIATYEGQWKNGVKSGVGVMTYSDGAKYQGTFLGGQRHGQGTFFYANGDIYCGEWAASRKTGSGAYIFKADSSRVQGTWQENKLLEGSFTDKFGNTYKGKFIGAGLNAVAYDPAGAFALCSGAAGTVRLPRRLVLYASNSPDKANFVAMMAPGVAAIEYDFETAGAAELVALISSAASQGKFDSIALANHGAGAAKGFSWPISKKVMVKNLNGLAKEPLAVLTALGDAVVEGGRVDLLACSLLETPKGVAAFEAIQKATRTHFAASDDVTGSVKSGGDWVMESDGVNVKSLYFGDTSAFAGTFRYGKPAVPVVEVEKPPELTDDFAYAISEGEYLMIGGEPCAVDRVIKSKQEVMFRGHSVFNDYILKDVTVNETDKVNQPVVTKTWWQVEKVEADEITPDMPDKYDTIHIVNHTQSPSKLALHALGKGAMMYIDMINDNLDRSTVEVQVLTACGKSQLVMKSVMKDIKFTPKAAAAQ